MQLFMWVCPLRHGWRLGSSTDQHVFLARPLDSQLENSSKRLSNGFVPFNFDIAFVSFSRIKLQQLLEDKPPPWFKRRVCQWWTCSPLSFFPTCQVRVVRFYHSCSPTLPPRLALLLLLLLRLLLFLLLQFLLDHVCINFHLHFRPANSSPSSSPTSELGGHRWTSTWDLPSSGSPLDLNLGPSQLSVHRWTSTAR